MPMAREELEARARQLPREERARLAEALISSLDEEAEVERAWDEEIRRRLQELDAGSVETVPGEEVLAELDKLVEAAQIPPGGAAGVTRGRCILPGRVTRAWAGVRAAGADRSRANRRVAREWFSRGREGDPSSQSQAFSHHHRLSTRVRGN